MLLRILHTFYNAMKQYVYWYCTIFLSFLQKRCPFFPGGSPQGKFKQLCKIIKQCVRYHSLPFMSRFIPGKKRIACFLGVYSQKILYMFYIILRNTYIPATCNRFVRFTKFSTEKNGFFLHGDPSGEFENAHKLCPIFCGKSSNTSNNGQK